MAKVKYTDDESENVVYKAKCLGDCQTSFLKQGGEAVVLGVTSKGLFLQNPSQQVCFVSHEPFRGPITINLHDEVDFKALTEVGDLYELRKDRIVFPNFQIVIQLGTPIFSPPTISFNADGVSTAIERCVDFAKTLIVEYEEGVFFPFLKKIIADYPNLEREEIMALIPDRHDRVSLFERLSGLLGFGRGLTPSGDDFICGFLLARHYLDPTFPTSIEYGDFVDQINTLAAQKTTSLSAALIACAAQGKADERILHTLDWIASGKRKQLINKEELLSYGSSSGIDTFAGMLAALLLL